MADKLKGFQALVWLLFLFGLRTYASLPKKCTNIVGKTTYLLTDWTWTVVGDKGKIYYINVCGKVDNKRCNKDSSVCSWAGSKSENLGSFSSRAFNSTNGAVGFSIEYTGGTCTGRSSESKIWKTTIFLRCGKFLGSPQFVDISVGGKTCVAVFEFVTNEACNKPRTVPEIPCSLYNDRDQGRRDLTPLIKLKGGYEVASSISDFDFHINVCRGITAEANGHTQGCPTNSSMCRVDKKPLGKPVDVGNINFASELTLSPTNDIILVYNTTEKVSGCLSNPVTTITFRCPKEMTDKGPVLTAAGDCMFEVLWETDYACPEATIMSTNSTSCVLDNHFVKFDLSKLTAAKLSNYRIGYDVMEQGKNTHYIIYMNVCKSLGFACGIRGTNSTVCQEKQDGAKRWSLGDISKQTLRYADRQLTLTYEHGEPCHSGLNRTTIIMFICDYQVDKGKPVFNSENYCFYYFDWRTKYACPPSRRTGTRCRVESPSGLRYDLSELVRMEDNSNWIALDGETSSSDKQIFINVCGQLTYNNETRQCDRAAAICMFEKSTGKVVSLGRYTDPPTLNQDNTIKLVYTEGSECKKDNTGKSIKINSTITFVCQPGDLESPPVLVTHSQDNCHYQFMWETAAACSLGLNRGKDCKVEDKDAGYVFDLSPLAKHTWNKSDYFSLTVDRSQYIYQLKVCGGSNQTRCPDSNIGACQIKSRDVKFHKKLGEPNAKLYYYDGMLNLTYVNGEQCHNGVNRTTHITFLCNATAVDNGIGRPEYEKEDHCVYNFRWFTKYACLTKITECIARSDSDQYDLTSLVKTKDNWQAQGAGGTFYINICRMLNLDGDISGCSGTASVCLKKDDGTFVNLGSVADAPRVDGKDITITYTNGDQCTQAAGKLYQTKITFICKKGLMSSSPKFVETADSGCTYKFRWETAAACKIENVAGDNCEVNDPKSDTTFNLLPLMKSQNKGVYNGTLTDDEGQGQFQLNICGDVPECRKGEDNVGACLKRSEGTMIVLGKSNKKLEYMGEILTLVYRGGDNFAATGQQREVHIKFYCNSKVPFGKPTFASQVGNKYFFDFQTSLVCSASAVQCLVTGKGNNIYDLTPLGLLKGNWEAVDTRPQDRHLHYYINVCRSVNLNYPQELTKCPGGAIGACQIDHKNDKGFNLGYVQSNPQVAENGDLTLQYLGGSECHHQFKRSIRIVFSCSKQMGSPIFLSESPECEYLFTWQTPSACALTREQGVHCTVEDKQYGYMFNLSTLFNGTNDYDVSVNGAPGVRIILNVCNKLVKPPKECGKSGGACITKDGKGTPIDTSSDLTYFNGQINMTYGKSPGPSVNFIFECDQDTSGLQTGPTCEKKSVNLYECHWQTAFACRPMINVQCSIRNEDGGVDDQYDYSPLSESTRNWQAQITGPNVDDVSYFINVCRTVLLKGAAQYCPPTAGVCMVDKGKAYNLGSIKRGPVKEGSNIYLMYDDGDDCGKDGKKYSSRIHMVCGSTQSEPVFVRKSQQTCQYEFMWITSTACPVNTNNEVAFNNCTAMNPRTKVLFDLNALRGNKDYVIYDKQNRSYHLNVCGPLLNAKPCNSKSGVCQVEQNAVFNAGMANSRLHFDDGVLYLNLSGGDDCHHVKKKRQTIISFVCQSDYGKGDIYGKPVFIYESDCTYYIMWHTSLVCERQYECAAFTKVGGSTVKYSLGRLMRSDANWLVTDEGGVKDSRSYYVNLCRPLVAMPGMNCPAGAWACGIGHDNPLDLGYATGPPVASEGEVELVYNGRTKCRDSEDSSKVWKVHFTFVCAYGTLGHPVLEAIDNCVVRIRWLTSAACGDGQKAELDKCRVYDNGTGEYYDLNPLSRPDQDHIQFEVDTASGVFFVSVCHALNLNKADNCTIDGGAGVCLMTKNGDNKFYKALGLFKFKDMTYYRDEGMLILKYCNHECNSKERNLIVSRIIFVCDRSQTSVGKPVLDTLGSYGADFTWRTNVVCPPMEEECSYSAGGKSFDLRLLTSRTRSWHYEHNGDRFWINICRGITDGPKGCPSTASVCMIRKASDKVNVVGVTSTQRMSVNDGELQLKYSGIPPVEGCSSGKNSKVVFHFECGNNIGQPQFESELWSACSFIIKWKSSVACQISREKLDENHCVVKYPVTGAQIDFGQLGSTWTIGGVDEKNKPVLYSINICGKLDDKVSSKECKDQDAVCFKNEAYAVASRTFFYEGSIFSLEMRTTRTCDNTNHPLAVVINFQCSVGVGVGSPKFDYVSSNCHHVFLWPTSIVCTVDLSQDVTDIPAVHKAQKSSAKKSVGIAFGVIFAVFFIVALAVILYKPSRRHSIISCLRWNFKRHVLRKEIKYPVYRYQKLDATGDDDEADSLIKEAEGSDDDEENDDDDLLPF